jgi:hypothetical protein
MWAFGIVLYEMATAYKPTAIMDYKYSQGNVPFRHQDWKKRDKLLQNLINSCI